MYQFVTHRQPALEKKIAKVSIVVMRGARLCRRASPKDL